jgi:hypothetical protein
MSNNTNWKLEDFVDSLVVELDKTRETLAVKAINKPLSYTVRELSLDLNAFATYDGDEVTFLTAQPGQEGASKVTIQLGTITDQQVRATSKTPASKDDVKLENTDLDKATKKKLRKIGVTSSSDLKTIENKNVDLQQATEGDIDYAKLANQIEKSKRARQPPIVRSASLDQGGDGHAYLTVRGQNLAVNPRFPPVAALGGELADVVESSEEEVRIRINRPDQLNLSTELILAVDPFAYFKIKLNARAPAS